MSEAGHKGKRLNSLVIPPSKKHAHHAQYHTPIRSLIGHSSIKNTKSQVSKSKNQSDNEGGRRGKEAPIIAQMQSVCPIYHATTKALCPCWTPFRTFPSFSAPVQLASFQLPCQRYMDCRITQTLLRDDCWACSHDELQSASLA